MESRRRRLGDALWVFRQGSPAGKVPEGQREGGLLVGLSEEGLEQGLVCGGWRVGVDGSFGGWGFCDERFVSEGLG